MFARANKIEGMLLAKVGSVKLGKRIIRNCRPDKIRRIRIKNRVVRIHDAIETRCGSRLNLGDGIDLTVAERTVVAPATTKHLVAFDSDRCQPGLVLGINQTIAEIEDTGPGATGDNLIEWIKWIEGIDRCVRLHLTGRGSPVTGSRTGA